MTRLVRAEILKLRTTMVPWVLAVIVVLLTTGVLLILFHQAAVTAYNATHPFLRPGRGFAYAPAWGTPSTPAQLRGLVDPVLGLQGYVLPIVFGTLIATGEYRHKTITDAFLVTPRRWEVVLAKVVVAALGGLLLAVVSLVTVGAVAVPFLAGQGGSVSNLLHQSTHVIPGMLAAFVLLGIVGVGIGMLLRNQVAALVASLVWFIIGEPIILSNFSWIGRWLFEASTFSVVQAGTGRGIAEGLNLLPWWGGAGMLLAYSAAILAAAVVFTVPRDVT